MRRSQSHLPALHDTPALLLTALSDVSASAVDELLSEGESANSQASYRGALRYWAGWFGLRYGQQIQLPVPVPVVLQFIVDHAQRSTKAGLVHELPPSIDAALVAAGFKGKPGPMALNTLVHRVAVLSKAHQSRGLANPCQEAKVRELLAKTRRAFVKRGVEPQKKEALTREPLLALLDTCDDSLQGLRDRALLLFAWASGGRRRSEVVLADMKFLRRYGPDQFSYTLAHSKTNQTGQEKAGNVKPVEGVAGAALAAWLAASGVQEGPIFRQVRKGGHLGAALSPSAVRDIVIRRGALAGLPAGFSAHSLRSGFVTEASLQQVPLAETMLMTGHRSVASVVRYHRFTDKHKVASLLDGAATPDKE